MVAERTLNPSDFPGTDPSLLVPGSMVFHMTKGPVDLREVRNWWSFVPRACWKHPEGKESTFEGRENHPVVQMAYEDALAYPCRKDFLQSLWAKTTASRLNAPPVTESFQDKEPKPPATNRVNLVERPKDVLREATGRAMLSEHDSVVWKQPLELPPQACSDCLDR
jgi:hypothetical protein